MGKLNYLYLSQLETFPPTVIHLGIMPFGHY